MKPLVIELFCGMFGWSQGWLELGGLAIGFDIEHLPHHGPVPPGAELVLQDVLTIHGSQFRNASLILASPPCQRYSYMAMPWKRAKAQAAEIRADETGAKLRDLNALFDACFRIQREASEAAGRYIPMVVENVKGAQPWVGPAKANYGSYYLWGDVANVGGRILRGDVPPSFGANSVKAMRNYGQKLPVGNCSDLLWKNRPVARLHNDGKPMRDGRKVDGFNFQEYEKTGKPGGSFQSAAVDSMKARAVHRKPGPKGCRTHDLHLGYGSTAVRKAASAAIAKIPLELSRHIAQVYWPGEVMLSKSSAENAA